ncbi:hypothetical protein IMZ48_24480 [Candidatus Bathyarchaeota archaeon]|nr:hypothetical protein [Candidatus Bathyarchaeota archaeon]
MTNTHEKASADEVHASDGSKVSAEHDESSPEKGSSSENDYDMPADEERRMVRKCDWRILPVVSALYVMSFLNRVNIGELVPSLSHCHVEKRPVADQSYLKGNARIFHLERDLGLTGNQYQICVSVLFVTYVTFEIPSNMMVCLFITP